MDLQRLKDITAELNKTTSENIIGVGYGLNEKNGKTLNEYCITFTVAKKLPLDQIPEEERIPSEIEIDGVVYKTDVTEQSIELLGYVDCSNDDPDFYFWQNTTPGNATTMRPIQGGVSISNYPTKWSSSGTMGFIAVDNEDNTLVGVSNHHVLVDNAFIATSRATTGPVTNIAGDYGTQASYVDGNFQESLVGRIKKYEPIYPETESTPNYVDAACVALSELDDQGRQVVSSNDSWKQFGLTGVTSPPRFATTNEINTVLSNPNQVFYSAGRTTGPKGEGLTKLYCTSPTKSIRIAYNNNKEEKDIAQIDDVFEYRAKGPTTPEGDWCYYPVKGGDSGSAILTEINGEYVIVGLVFAGGGLFGVLFTGYACRIDHVATALNIRAWDGSLNGVGFSNTTNPETYVIEGFSSEKAIIRNGKTYWQVGITNDNPTL